MPAMNAALPAAPATGPSAATEARAPAQGPGKAAKTQDGDSHAADAFIAALLAQGTPQAVDPATPAGGVETATAVLAGQDLPVARPGLAAAAVTRQPLTPATADPPGAEAAPADGAQDEFASAFVALQDAMTGGGTARSGEHGTQGDDGAALAGSSAVSELGAAGGHGAGHQALDAGRALDALAGAHASRAHEAPAPAQTYAAKPAPLPMDQPALFAERLNQHISFMIGDEVQSAQIAVTPADLGPVEVRVTMVGDEAKIQLSATHAATREALNEALPRLRASFAEAGISLAQAGVFAQMPERQQAAPSFVPEARGGESDFELAPLASVSPGRSLKIGLIDAFV